MYTVYTFNQPFNENMFRKIDWKWYFFEQKCSALKAMCSEFVSKKLIFVKFWKSTKKYDEIRHLFCYCFFCTFRKCSQIEPQFNCALKTKCLIKDKDRINVWACGVFNSFGQIPPPPFKPPLWTYRWTCFSTWYIV